MNRHLLSLIEDEYGRYKALGEGAMRQLSDDDLVRNTAGANSIAMIVWHIAGNLESRFTDFLTTDGEKPWRNRESEFEPRTPARPEIEEKWDRGWGILFSSLRELTDDDLGRTVMIRGVSMGVDDALLRSVAHAAHHVGQIVYLGKCFRRDSWEYLSIPPGKSDEYNANPVFEKAGRHAKGLARDRWETMDFDYEGHLGAVERSVSSLERDGQPARAVTLTRSYATTVEDLWDAVTKAERIPRWFLPVSGELEPGGRYQLEGNAGGAITACEPLSRFAVTWEFGGDVSWLEVRVSDDGAGRARLTLTHTQHLSDHWDAYGAGAVGVGWEMGLLGLAIHLAHPDRPMPDEAAFAASSDGKAFITGSSDGWAQAAIAFGTDPGAARSRAAQTTAFYTGESPESAVCANSEN